MPRTNSRGLELSFHPTSRRWYKSGKHEFPDVLGHRVYFGAGRSVDDRPSYAAALERYNAHKDQQAAERGKSEAVQMLRRVLEVTDPYCDPPDLKPDTAAAKLAALLRPKDRPMEDRDERREVLAKLDALPLAQLRQVTDAPQPAAGRTVTTVAALVADFVRAQEGRHAMGQAIDAKAKKGEAVQAPPKAFVGTGRLVAIRRDTKHLTDLLGGEAWDGTEATAARLLAVWRSDSERLFTTGRHKVGTFNDRMKIGRQLVGWAEQNFHLDRLPRNLKTLCSKFQHTSTAKAIPLADLRQIWDRADDMLRTWIALGLNCGYYAQDLSDLTAWMIDGEYLDHGRGKTGVNVKYKLWPVTLALLARNRMDDGTPAAKVFQAVSRRERGRRSDLVHHAARGRSDAVRQRFEGLVKEKLGWTEKYTDREGKEREKARYTWSNVRDTGTTAVENLAPAFADMYDSHRDKRQARFYIDGKHVETAPFDAILDKLGNYFALPLPDPPKPKKKGIRTPAPRPEPLSLPSSRTRSTPRSTRTTAGSPRRSGTR